MDQDANSYEHTDGFIASERGPYIQTFTGRRFYLLDPRVEDIDLWDIAHALSHEARFGGHTHRPYSVGQHSIRVALDMPPEFALWGLLHDAHEAYLKDIPSPVKLLVGPDYKRAASDIQRVVWEWAGLDPTVCPTRLLKRADLRALAAECRDFMLYYDLGVPGLPVEAAHPERITPLDAEQVRMLFVRMYHTLRGGPR